MSEVLAVICALTTGPVSPARSSPVPGVVAYTMGNDQSRREHHLTWPIIMARVVCKFPAGSGVFVWDHGRNNKDNVMISDMFSTGRANSRPQWCGVCRVARHSIQADSAYCLYTKH